MFIKHTKACGQIKPEQAGDQSFSGLVFYFLQTDS